MALEQHREPAPQVDEWLESHCQQVYHAGRELAEIFAEVNERVAQARTGELGRRRKITEGQLRKVESACKTLHDVQVAVQNALFDCEYELRSLRERDVSPAELLVDGERLIRQYRFFRRRARILDGLLAYLPVVSQHAMACLEEVRRTYEGGSEGRLLKAPDCSFALVALDLLNESDAR